MRKRRFFVELILDRWHVSEIVELSAAEQATTGHRNRLVPTGVSIPYTTDDAAEADVSVAIEQFMAARNGGEPADVEIRGV